MNHLMSPIFIAVVLLSSPLMSASPNHRNHSAAPRYRLDITDRPAEKRFVLTLKSLDDRPLCIHVEKWPNRKGQVHFGRTWVKLESAEHTYAARDENFGYCIDESGKPCLLKILPGATLKGFVGYEQFGDPIVIANLAHRKLHFLVSPRVCEK
jgi:hypothetical protein